MSPVGVLLFQFFLKQEPSSQRSPGSPKWIASYACGVSSARPSPKSPEAMPNPRAHRDDPTDNSGSTSSSSSSSSSSQGSGSNSSSSSSSSRSQGSASNSEEESDDPTPRAARERGATIFEGEVFGKGWPTHILGEAVGVEVYQTKGASVYIRFGGLVSR